MAEDFELPRSYEKYREVLKRTLKKCINIKAEIASTGPFDSKFGGDPYFPKNEAYPVDEGSAPLRFLAQINFEQVPCLKNYPKTRILQFYAGLEAGVAISDDEFKQSGYRVIYFETVETDESKLVSDFRLRNRRGMSYRFRQIPNFSSPRTLRLCRPVTSVSNKF